MGEEKSVGEVLMCMPQRERGGSIASDRFDYQKNWTLCKMLRLHREARDYLILCEFHEDVTVLDAENASSVIFYQIKTDASHPWTVKRLTGRRNGENGHALPSILGRLCSKVGLLPPECASYRFVSNAAFNFRLNSPVRYAPGVVVHCSLFHSDELKKLSEALKDELGLDVIDALEQRVAFEMSELPLVAHSETTKGMLADFIDQYAAGCSLSISPLYRTLFDEIRRRTAAEPDSETFEALCRRKGISRADFDRMLQSAIRSTPADRTWALIEQRLTAEGASLDLLLRLSRAFREYYVRRLNPVDSALQHASRQLVETASQLLSAQPRIVLLDLATQTVRTAATSDAFLESRLSEEQAYVLVMVEMYERRDGEIQAVGAQPPQGVV